MIPNFFSKEPIPPITNPALLKAIDEVRACNSKETALQKAFDIVTARFRGYHFMTYILFWKALENDPNKLWERTGFMHCQHQNFLLRILLVESVKFTEADIEHRYSLVWYVSPHQYMVITLPERKIAVDPWNAAFGAKLGQYAFGFGFNQLPTTFR